MPFDQPPPPPPALAAPAPHAKRWLLLDPYTARHNRIVALGLASFRPLSARVASTGYSLAFGEAITTVRGAFLAGGLRETELRLVPDDSFTLALSRHQWEAGLRLGALEPVVRIGITALHLDYGRAGLCFGMFSPRVGAGMWLALGRTRIGVSVFSEYYWRWFGGESAFVHGLLLELQPWAGPLVQRSTTSSPSPSPPGRR